MQSLGVRLNYRHEIQLQIELFEVYKIYNVYKNLVSDLIVTLSDVGFKEIDESCFCSDKF